MALGKRIWFSSGLLMWPIMLTAVSPTQNPGQAIITQSPTASIYLGVHVHFTCQRLVSLYNIVARLSKDSGASLPQVRLLVWSATGYVIPIKLFSMPQVPHPENVVLVPTSHRVAVGTTGTNRRKELRTMLDTMSFNQCLTEWLLFECVQLSAICPCFNVPSTNTDWKFTALSTVQWWALPWSLQWLVCSKWRWVCFSWTYRQTYNQSTMMKEYRVYWELEGNHCQEAWTRFGDTIAP